MSTKQTVPGTELGNVDAAFDQTDGAIRWLSARIDEDPDTPVLVRVVAAVLADLRAELVDTARQLSRDA